MKYIAYYIFLDFGGIAGAYIMSKVMEDVGRYVGESLDDSEYTIDRYHQRAK